MLLFSIQTVIAKWPEAVIKATACMEIWVELIYVCSRVPLTGSSAPWRLCRGWRTPAAGWLDSSPLSDWGCIRCSRSKEPAPLPNTNTHRHKEKIWLSFIKVEQSCLCVQILNFSFSRFLSTKFNKYVFNQIPLIACLSMSSTPKIVCFNVVSQSVWLLYPLIQTFVTWKWGLEIQAAICLKRGSWTRMNWDGSITSRISSISPRNITWTHERTF